jgi:DNA-binding response OmpR family regulator
MRALAADTSLVGSFTQICRELGIEPEPVTDFENVFDLVNQRKYEAVFLDTDTVRAVLPVLTALRESRSNKSAVAFVIATQAEENAQALVRRAHFVFCRPLNIDEINQACRAAYDFMLEESRRYFRKNANLSVRIASHKTLFESSTLNISGNGMAVRTR